MMALVFGSAEAAAALAREKNALKVEIVVDGVSDEWANYASLKEQINDLQNELAEAESELWRMQNDWERRGISYRDVEEVMEARHGKDG